MPETALFSASQLLFLFLSDSIARTGINTTPGGVLHYRVNYSHGNNRNRNCNPNPYETI